MKLSKKSSVLLCICCVFLLTVMANSLMAFDSGLEININAKPYMTNNEAVLEGIYEYSLMSEQYSAVSTDSILHANILGILFWGDYQTDPKEQDLTIRLNVPEDATYRLYVIAVTSDGKIYEHNGYRWNEVNSLSDVRYYERLRVGEAREVIRTISNIPHEDIVDKFPIYYMVYDNRYYDLDDRTLNLNVPYCYTYINMSSTTLPEGYWAVSGSETCN